MGIPFGRLGLSLELAAPYPLALPLAIGLWRKAPMRFVLPALSLLLLTACAGGDRPVATALPGAVAYEVSSWGQPLTSWRITPNGTGELERGPGFGKAGPVARFRVTMRPETLHAFIAIVEPLRERTAKPIECRYEITDMPYGNISWDYPQGMQAYAFNAGCRSAEANAVLDRLRAATELIETQAALEPIASR